MKITVPSVQINKEEGFSPEKDIFSRIEFGERLANLIAQSDDELVIAIDAEWGEGKSTFIQMWNGFVSHHREPKIRTIYFDAFANDYQKDPFIALAAEVYELLKDETQEKKKEFLSKAGAAAKSMARGAIKIAVRVGTGGILGDSVVDDVGKDISELLAERVDEVLADRLKSSSTDKLALNNFRKYLEGFAKEHGGGQPIVFVIDELDRCRPDFALELIEQIKHLFSVRGITFLLVMNRKQLEESIKSKYGIIDATKYLQKFVHLWLTLPRKSGPHDDHGVRYVKHAMSAMCKEGEIIHNHEAVKLIEDMVKYLKPSFRDIERMLSYFALIQNMTDSQSFLLSYQTMIAFMCYLKSSKPHLIEKIAHQNIDSATLLKEAGLDRIDGNSESTHIHYLSKCVIFDLANDEQQKMMIADKEAFPNDDYGSKEVMKNVCGWLSEIHRNK